MEQTTLERRVRVIPATKTAATSGPRRGGRQRVAAYCRVSTDSEEQLNSYAAQKNYYTQKIEENPDWEMAGVFADERIILGTSQEVLAPQGFPDLVLIFIWPEINGPYGRLIRKCVELSPLPIRRAA